MKTNIIYNKDCLLGIKELPDNSFDLLCTDPPYGISFMGKQWDRAIPSLAIWRESLRVLKPGAFAFVMCIPRQDCLARMIVSLEDAGFNVSFSPIYHTFASGFPKAQNIGKAVDKRLGKELIKLGFKRLMPDMRGDNYAQGKREYGGDTVPIYYTKPATPQAQALDGSYSYNPKPAVEIVIVAQKPKTAKTYVDQALLWYEERQRVLRGLAIQLEKCYNVGKVEWES